MVLVGAVSLIKRVRSDRNWNTGKSWERGVKEIWEVVQGVEYSKATKASSKPTSVQEDFRRVQNLRDVFL